MVHLVDTVDVAAEDADRYLEAVRSLGVPVMTDAGAGFVSCASTAPDPGGHVRIQVVWSFSDHGHWNLIRRNLVLDERWYRYGARLAALRTGGTRRFYRPAAFSPS